MFTLHNPMKVLEGNYVVTSHPCPMCGTTKTVPIAGDKLFAYHNGAMAQEVLSAYDADIRERFISGICEKCWSFDEHDLMCVCQECDPEFNLEMLEV